MLEFVLTIAAGFIALYVVLFIIGSIKLISEVQKDTIMILSMFLIATVSVSFALGVIIRKVIGF